jgi:hypothetical protein
VAVPEAKGNVRLAVLLAMAMFVPVGPGEMVLGG